jgi:hypothetical protein
MLTWIRVTSGTASIAVDTARSGAKPTSDPLTGKSMGNLEKDYEGERRGNNQCFQTMASICLGSGNSPKYHWPPIQILIAMADGRAKAKPLNLYVSGRVSPANRAKQGWTIKEA